MSWGIVIVAGGLCPDELAVRLGTPRKALARFGDTTALEIVLEAAAAADIGPIVTVSGQDLAPYIHYGGIVEETTSAVDNAIAGSAMLNTERLLILPADMPFVTAASIREYVERLNNRISNPLWYSAGVCRLRAFREAFPTWETSPVFLKEGRVLSGGFFATTPEGLAFGRDLFNSIRRSRKNQFAMIRKFGMGALVRYFCRLTSVREAEEMLGNVLQGQVILDMEADPVSILDYDNVAEYDVALRLYEDRLLT